MYKDEIEDIIKQNRVCNLKFMRDALIIYTKLLIFANNKKELRKRFLEYVRNWLKYSKNENELLHYIIKKYGNVIDSDDIDIILDELDDIFTDTFNYYDLLFDGFSTSIDMHNEYRANIKNPDFKVLDDETKKVFIKRINDCHINE